MFNSKNIQQIADLLTSQGQSIAVAESVTAGLLQNAFSSAERASEFFEGGMTVYNIKSKICATACKPCPRNFMQLCF
jgi:nicotinamide-nucleotide amidase